VIVAGRVVQRGAYAELVAQAGIFAELIERRVA
jgi:ABC-type multidrug transport system fused ATPase/permease subunit